jgi:hypothetical protein
MLNVLFTAKYWDMDQVFGLTAASMTSFFRTCKFIIATPSSYVQKEKCENHSSKNAFLSQPLLARPRPQALH